MPITLVVEDGTGLADANSYATVEQADAYWVARGGNETWEGYSTEERKAKLIIAFDYINGKPGYRWRGTKTTTTQRGVFPRTGASERDGASYGATEIPWRLREAQIVLAPRITDLVTLLPDLERGGQVTSESLSGIYSVSYAQGAPAGTVIQTVDGILQPLLRSNTGVLAFPTHTTTKTPDVFLSEHYSAYTDDASTTDEDG